MNIEELVLFDQKYKKVEISNEEISIGNLHDQSYFNKLSEVYSCDGFGNINVGLYCKTKINSKKLLVVVGESWTYGDSLKPYVKCVDNLDNIPYRVSTIFSGKVANYLNSDLLLYSQPGDSNINYWRRLEVLLSFVYEQKYYDDVYLIVQLTSPGRDYNTDTVHDRIKHLYSLTKNEYPVLSWSEWLYEYDKTYFNWLQEIVTKYPIKSTVLWKNFNEFHYKERIGYNFDVIETPFHRYSVEMSGVDVNLSNCLEMTFYEHMSELYNLKIDMKIMEEELDKINIGFDKLGKSMLNNWHPNDNGHWVLTSLFREKIKK